MSVFVLTLYKDTLFQYYSLGLWAEAYICLNKNSKTEILVSHGDA